MSHKKVGDVVEFFIDALQGNRICIIDRYDGGYYCYHVRFIMSEERKEYGYYWCTENDIRGEDGKL